MRRLSLPVLLREDLHGNVTGYLLDYAYSATASSERQVLRELREVLTWQARQTPWGIEASELGESPVLTQIAVNVRPEYRVSGEDGRPTERVYLSDAPVRLLLDCIYGEVAGLGSCVVPQLKLRFNIASLADVKQLVAHAAAERLGGQTPAQLTEYLPATRSWLDRVLVEADAWARGGGPPAERTPLEEVAERITRRGMFAAAWGRDEELAALTQLLERERAPVVVVGPSGCGKSTLIAGVAQRAAELAREQGRDHGGYWLSGGGRFIAGMPYLGQWEARAEEAVAELGRQGGVLWVESLLDLIQNGGWGPEDSVAAFLGSYLAAGELRLVCEATPAELAIARRLLPDMVTLTSPLVIDGFDKPAAAELLARVASLEKGQVEPGVAQQTVELFARFQPYTAFPGPAVAFLRRTIAAHERARLEEGGPEALGRGGLLAAFARSTGLPERLLRDEQALDADAVEAEFAQAVIGQPEACAAAARMVATFKAGLNDPGRPLGVLLFCGPTGVGKTELARQLAHVLFGAGGDVEQRLIRLDMSEFSHPAAADRLIAGEGGASKLIERLRQQPFSVVLFDEIEKAAPTVFDVLLAVLDEGRLTDPRGRLTTFCSALIVMTSNLGAGGGGSLGFGPERAPSYEDAARRFFRPEFFNRIDQLVSFDALGPEAIERICVRELGLLGQREGIAGRGLALDYGPALLEHLAGVGFDATYGARPLKQAIEREVVGAIAALTNSRPELAQATISLDVVGGSVVASVSQ